MPLLARAQDSQPPRAVAPAPVATPNVSTFALDEIGQHAEQVASQLRGMTEAISDEGAFAALEGDVFRYSHRVAERWKETDLVLAESRRRAPLETLASSWRALRTELEDLRSQVDKRALKRAADAATLERLQKQWIWTQDHANTVGAPAQVISRVQATLAAIEATRVQVDARNTQVLVLQDAVSRATQACDDAAVRIADARKDSISRIFAQNVPPVWHLLATAPRSQAGPAVRMPLADEVALVADSVRIYGRAYRGNLAVSLAITLLMIWALLRVRPSRMHAPASAHGSLPEFVADALRSPIAMAIMLSLFITRPLRPDQPAALIQLIYLIGLPAALLVLRPVLDSRLVPPFIAISAFFLVEVARGTLKLGSGVEQLVVILEMAAATGVLFWIAALLPSAVGALVSRSLWMRTTGRWVVRSAGFATALASVAAAFGYVELADFVGGGALVLIYLAIAVLALRVAGGAALWLVLVKSPLARLRSIERNHARLESAIIRVFEYVALALWFTLAFERMELLDPTLNAIDAVLDARLKAGELDVSVGHVLGFPAVVVGAWLTSRVVVFALEEDFYPRMNLARGVPYALSTMVRYGLLLAGFFAALAMLGLDLSKLTVLVSAFGLGLGFGMQQIINNFVSGLILLFERPVQVGDLVQMSDLTGEVQRIGIRSSRIRTLDGAEVIIPNSQLVQTEVTNWTLSDRRRRVTLDLGVTYGTEARRVLELLVAIAEGDPRVLRDPHPEAFFAGFGASSLDFQLRFWTEDPLWLRVKSDIAVALQQALREAGIAVPFTTVTVQVESADARKTE